ncbi:hypothetical protein, partial [Klebsiella pneumoniae]|uniref:hypothetical protein n=1 Tax=Klebsiella pneumoniae TaxID=573 RepID=UPI0024DE7ABF
ILGIGGEPSNRGGGGLLGFAFGTHIIVGLELETAGGGGIYLTGLISKGSDLSGDRSDQISAVGVVVADEIIELKSSSN